MQCHTFDTQTFLSLSQTMASVSKGSQFGDDISSLKNKLQRGWAQLEGIGSASSKKGKGNDEEITATSVLKAFDADGDGVLEGSEIEKISKHLNSQMEYNNDLIRQLADMEKQQLYYHKEISEKQNALRQAISACEVAKADIGDLKYRLDSAHTAAARAIEEANNAKIEANVKGREIDGLKVFVEEAKQELNALGAERDDLVNDINEIKQEKENLHQELMKKEEEDAIREAEHKADLENLSREIAQMKSRLGPLEAELRAERNRSLQLANDLEERNAAIRDMDEAVAEARSIAVQAQDQALRATQAEEDLKAEIEQKNKKLQQAEQQVVAARELANATESDVADMRKKIADLTRANREFDDEAKDLKTQLEAVGNDLHTQTIARRQDREHLEGKLAEARDELNRALEDKRQNERQFVDDLSKKEAEMAKARKEADDALVRAQKESRQLGDMVQKLQNDQQAQLANFQDERDAYDSKIANAVEAQRQAEARVNQRDNKSAQEVNTLREQLLEAQQQLVQRTQIHVDTLGALETTLSQLASECQSLQTAHDSLMDETEALRSAIRDQSDEGATLIETWYSDSRKSLIELAESASQAKVDAVASRDAQFAAESMRDEERSRAFILEEERNRIADELNELKDRLRNLEIEANDKTRASKAEIESVNATKLDLESQMKRLQQQLEKANTQNRSLQQDNEKSIANANELIVKNRKKQQELEERLSKLEETLRDVVMERDETLAEQSLLKKKLDSANANVTALQEELRSLESKGSEKADQVQKMQAMYQKQITTLNEGTRKQQTQLLQTKNLLGVVQEQRKHLQEEVIQLRAELDRYLVKQLETNMQGPASYLGNTIKEPSENGYHE